MIIRLSFYKKGLRCSFRQNVPPVFSSDVTGKVTDVFRGDDRAGFQSHGSEYNVAVQFLGIGGGLATTGKGRAKRLHGEDLKGA